MIQLWSIAGFPLKCTPVFRPLSALMLQRGWRRKLRLRRGLGGERGKWVWKSFPSLFPLPCKPYVFIFYHSPLHRAAISNWISRHCCHVSSVNAKQLFIWDLKDLLCNDSKREGLGHPNIRLLYNTIIAFSKKRKKKHTFILGKCKLVLNTFTTYI